MAAGAALKHYHDTDDQFPLVVKLGTITRHGADVFSYAADENDLVIDPYLKQHLKHWGIDMDKMEKSVKTMSELQVRCLPYMRSIIKCNMLSLHTHLNALSTACGCPNAAQHFAINVMQ